MLLLIFFRRHIHHVLMVDHAFEKVEKAYVVVQQQLEHVISVFSFLIVYIKQLFH